jgi:prepilin-type N-terminal cleavage/methylation domain-containing protein
MAALLHLLTLFFMSNRIPQLRRNGFTLIELLAASMLAALLTLTVLRVVSTFARTQAHRGVDSFSVLEPIGHDFTNARAIRIESDRVSFIVRDDSPKRSQVAYGVATIAGHSWLTRQESSVDSPVASAREELVAPDVVGFSAAAGTPTTRPTDMPDKLSVVIHFSNRSAVSRTLLK